LDLTPSSLHKSEEAKVDLLPINNSSTCVIDTALGMNGIIHGRVLWRRKRNVRFWIRTLPTIDLLRFSRFLSLADDPPKPLFAKEIAHPP